MTPYIPLLPSPANVDEKHIGKRRVDRIVYNPELPYNQMLSYRISTALGSNTDHLVVNLVLEQGKG